jgi:phage recombination protein Bet
MTTAIATRDETAVALPKEQIELIRKTVAAGATDTELQLFLYDCSRRGIHPLDRLLHFTKRGGRYTPVTSIDFMRSQAAMSGEMAGSDDPRFEMDGQKLVAATVTVYRMTQGQRFPYQATARWSEYCPDNAPMWKRMPHTMLGKCAEALALRKAFPQQLAGLYSREEMDQADKGGYTVEAPAKDMRPVVETVNALAAIAPSSSGKTPDFGPGDAGSTPAGAATDDGPDQQTDALRIQSVDRRPTSNKNVVKFVIHLSDNREVTTIKTQLGDLAEQICQDGDAVMVETKETKWGLDLLALQRVETVIQREAVDHGAPLTDRDIPF